MSFQPIDNPIPFRIPDDAFEPYHRNQRTSGNPTLSLGKSGGSSLNRALLELLGRPEYVCIEFAPKYQAIRLTPVTQGERDACKLSYKSGNNCASLSFTGVRQMWGIPVSSVWSAIDRLPNGAVVVRLDGPANP